MNKQEAIKKIKQLPLVNYSSMEFVEEIIDIVNQIDQPQKVVVPKFVAEWIEETKRIYNLYGVIGRIKDNLAPPEIMEWFYTNPTSTGEILARARLDGYEIEQEKLYTVEIPDPNRPDIATFLYKENGKVFIGTDIFLDEVPNYKWKNEPENQLTESEIKEDFEWAWQFAKEVE